MLPEEALKDLLSQRQTSNTDKLLLCLAVGPDPAKQVKHVLSLAVDNGLRSAKNWNISQLLSRSDKAVNTKNGWQLTGDGMQHVAKLAGPLLNSPIPRVASSLRATLSKLTNPQTIAFVEEAIGCFETGRYRAAVVLSWVGAVSILHNHVANDSARLAAFNADATARFAKSRNAWVAAKNADDLGRMNEASLLVVLESISIIGKNLKQQLEICLKLRNSCGHPNNYKLGENKVAAHIEDLTLNVYAVY